MDDHAFALARLRAAGPSIVDDADAVAGQAVRAGRRALTVHDGPRGSVVALGWPDDADVSPETWPITVRGLSSSTLLTLAACLGCCWRDPGADPFPGEVVTASCVLRVVRSRGLDERWAKAALHDLTALGYIAREDDGHIRLGPAVAVLTPSDVALLRRDHASLPREELP